MSYYNIFSRITQKRQYLPKPYPNSVTDPQPHVWQDSDRLSSHTHSTQLTEIFKWKVVVWTQAGVSRVQCEHKQAWTLLRLLQTATTDHLPSASLNCAALNTWIFIGIYFAKPMEFTFWLSGWRFGCHLIKVFITWHSPVFIRYKQMLSLKCFH